MATKPRYYAIHKGRTPGVYDSWAKAKQQIDGFSGSVHKGFSNLEDAKRFVDVGNLKVVGMVNFQGERSYLVNKPSNGIDVLPIDVLLKNLKRKRESVEEATTLEPVTQKVQKTGEIVTTDGACRDNGKSNARASYGVFFGDGDSRNTKGMVPWKPWTNQRGELFAILRALQIYEKGLKSGGTLTIRTDSKYSIDVFTKWIQVWKRRGFVTTKGTPVENQDIIMPAYEYIERYSVDLIHVRGHNGDHGNVEADRLANEALDEYEANN